MSPPVGASAPSCWGERTDIRRIFAPSATALGTRSIGANSKHDAPERRCPPREVGGPSSVACRATAFRRGGGCADRASLRRIPGKKVGFLLLLFVAALACCPPPPSLELPSPSFLVSRLSPSRAASRTFGSIMALAADVVAGSFGELAAAVQAIGLQRHLPAIAGCGVSRIGDLHSAASSLLAAGVPAQDIEILVTIRPPRQPAQAPEPLAVPGRPDVPVRRREASASLAAALEAAVPANRKRALDALDAGVLASSSRRPVESRLRTWRRLAREPWPIDVELVRCLAASFKAGAYRSAQNYFDAAVWFQEAYLHTPVSPLVKKAIRRYVRSATRGLPGANLKDAFPFDAVALRWRTSTSTPSASRPPLISSTSSSSPPGSCCVR